MALHLCLYPQVETGMIIMKFANNQPHSFEKHGSEISFMIGFTTFVIALYCEALNIYMLTFQLLVSEAIIYFVSLHVVMELPKMYFDALTDNPLKEILTTKVKVEKKGKDIKFGQRSCFHKVARAVYCMVRAIYVSVVFYFVPYYVLFINFWMSSGIAAEEEE